MEDDEKIKLEKEKLEVERQKHDLERQKFEFEKSKSSQPIKVEGESVFSSANKPSSSGKHNILGIICALALAITLHKHFHKGLCLHERGIL